MTILGISVNIGLLILVFMIGRAVQKWADGTMEVEEGAYNVGFEEGYEEGKRDGQARGHWIGKQQGYADACREQGR